MQFRFKLQYLLVRLLVISNKEAMQLITEGSIRINESIVFENSKINETDEIFFKDRSIRKPKQMFYCAYHKPRGIETTLNTSIENNLKNALPFDFDFFPIGRLDKESEGLLLLTNDGYLYKKLMNKDNAIPKVYEVEVNKDITNNLLPFLENGVEILGKKTLSCNTKQLDHNTFEITLVEGMNRQIRRMCYKAGYLVKKLTRVSFAGIPLDIQQNQYRQLTENEIAELKSL
ncbi:MAG TPA: RNA pseudouridine synthase [Bacteroidia bacterium]|nr:RNA pseudouridine synthase [Bacteroidia bacterium]